MPGGDAPKLDSTAALQDVYAWAEICEGLAERLENWYRKAFADTSQLSAKTEEAIRFRVRQQGDQHFMIVAAKHLATALEAADDPGLVLRADLEHAVGILRRIYEHWDEQRPAFEEPDATLIKAGKAFRESWPDQTPFASGWSATEGISIGPVSVKALIEDVRWIKERRRELGVIPG